ncbi:MAG: hypothetical protein IPM21_01650 [Acidobacteria bacterium]|nr:hypothetical protein [Acidobacteriota bacterium]
MTGEEHNKYVSWAFLGYGIFQAVMLLLVAAVFLIVFGAAGASDPNFPAVLFGVIALVAVLINALFVVPSFVAYYAMKNRKPWARIAAIVAGALAVMSMPFGTAAGVYAFVFFLGEDWKQVYEPQRPPHMLRDDAGFGSTYGRDDQTAADRDAQFQYREPPDWR